MLTIDGSYGEGGGQILRSSLVLSAVLKRPVLIEKIRAGRKNPGLQAQHLAGVRALAEVTRARVEGATGRSVLLSFVPGEIAHGKYRWDVGTAGAISLVLQTILIPLAMASASSHVSITGGTHVPWSPPFPYVEQILLPVLEKMGLRASFTLKRWGFYPKGGGAVEGTVEPSVLGQLALTERGPLREIAGLSAVGGVPLSVAERQRDRALSRLKPLGVPCRIDCCSVEAKNPGTVLFLGIHCDEARAGCSSLGERGKPAERVADEACDEVFAYLDGTGATDPHLADQLLIPMALAPGSSALTTTRVTEHLLSNRWVVEQFLPGRVRIEGKVGQSGLVTVD